MGTGEGVATAAFDLDGLAPGTRAGLCRHSDRYQLLSVVDDGDERRLVMNDDGDRIEGPAIAENTIQLRTRNVTDTAWFEYSIDGRDFERIGPDVELTFGNWNGDRIGVHCWNDDQPAGYLDVRWFEYEYDGPRGDIDRSRTAASE
jgi:beta-xylosidase